MTRAAALPFHNALDRITEAPAPVFLRTTCLALGLLLVSAIAASSILTLDIVVSGPGVLATDHPTALLQPLDRAMVRSLRVRAGDHVHRGDILATLDPTFALADEAALQAQHRSLSAEIARLQAEADGVPYRAASGDEAALQQLLFAQRRAALASRLASFDQAMARDAAGQATARAQAASLARQADIAGTVLRLRAELLRGAVGSRLQYLDAAQAADRAQAALRETQDRLTELSHAAQSEAADRQTFLDEWRREVIEALAARRADLAQSSAALAKAARMAELVTVVAPEDGVILQVAQRAPGSTAGGADPLLTLLPAHAALVAELTVKSSDIGQLRPGDAVRVKVDAYPFQRYGVLTGRVRSIAAASQAPDAARAADPLTAGAVHRVSVDLDSTTLAGLPDGAGPTPGMTVSGDVRVGTRTVLAYFMAPVTRGFAQSLREP